MKWTEDGTAVVFPHRRNDDGTWNIYSVPIFITHSRGEETFDRERLDRIVDNQHALPRAKKARVVISHDSPFGGKSGSVCGNLRNMRRRGDVIVADYLNLRPAVFREIFKGGLPQRSVELNPNDLNSIEAIALLGREQPYFPFADTAVRLTKTEEAQLDMDVEKDRSFQWSRDEAFSTAHLYQFKELTTMNPKVYRKDNEGNLILVKELYKEDGSTFEITPEDGEHIRAMMQEEMAPVKEGVALALSEIESLKAGNESGMDEGYMKPGEDDPDEAKRKSGEDPKPGDKPDDEDESKREAGEEEDDDGDDVTIEVDTDDEDDEDEEDKNKRARKGATQNSPEKGESNNSNDSSSDEGKGSPNKYSSADRSTIEDLAESMVKTHKLESKDERGEIRARLVEVIDPAQYGDVEKKINEYVNKAMQLKTEAREWFLDGIVRAYTDGGVPKGKLKPTKKDEGPNKTDIRKKAFAYFDERADKGLMPYAGFGRDEFADHCESNYAAMARIIG